jgi:hypothetical protein
MTQLVQITPPRIIVDRIAEIERLAAKLRPHAAGANDDATERKELVSAALDLKDW